MSRPQHPALSLYNSSAEPQEPAATPELQHALPAEEGGQSREEPREILCDAPLPEACRTKRCTARSVPGGAERDGENCTAVGAKWKRELCAGYGEVCTTAARNR
eukprot:3180525-Rhodomonas_salina.1